MLIGKKGDSSKLFFLFFILLTLFSVQVYSQRSILIVDDDIVQVQNGTDGNMTLAQWYSLFDKFVYLNNSRPEYTDSNTTLEQQFNRAWQCNTPDGKCYINDGLNVTGNVTAQNSTTIWKKGIAFKQSTGGGASIYQLNNNVQLVFKLMTDNVLENIMVYDPNNHAITWDTTGAVLGSYHWIGGGDAHIDWLLSGSAIGDDSVHNDGFWYVSSDNHPNMTFIFDGGYTDFRGEGVLIDEGLNVTGIVRASDGFLYQNNSRPEYSGINHDVMITCSTLTGECFFEKLNATIFKGEQLKLFKDTEEPLLTFQNNDSADDAWDICVGETGGVDTGMFKIARRDEGVDCSSPDVWITNKGAFSLGTNMILLDKKYYGGGSAPAQAHYMPWRESQERGEIYYKSSATGGEFGIWSFDSTLLTAFEQQRWYRESLGYNFTHIFVDALFDENVTMRGNVTVGGELNATTINANNFLYLNNATRPEYSGDGNITIPQIQRLPYFINESGDRVTGQLNVSFDESAFILLEGDRDIRNQNSSIIQISNKGLFSLKGSPIITGIIDARGIYNVTQDQPITSKVAVFYNVPTIHQDIAGVSVPNSPAFYNAPKITYSYNNSGGLGNPDFIALESVPTITTDTADSRATFNNFGTVKDDLVIGSTTGELDINHLFGFWCDQRLILEIGGDVDITNKYCLRITDDSVVGGKIDNDYGIYSDKTAGDNKHFIYDDGGANSTWAGRQVYQNNWTWNDFDGSEKFNCGINAKGKIYCDGNQTYMAHSEKSWAFASPSGGGQTFYIGGFYDLFSGNDNFNPALANIGEPNSAHASHFLIVCEAGGGGGTDTVIRVSGTSITDAGVRDATPDTEDITIDDAGGAGAYYETSKKWLGEVQAELQSGPDVECNYGFSKYWDNNNQDFVISGFDVTWLAGANDDDVNIGLRKHTTTGWTYNAGSTPTPPSYVADLDTDYSTDDSVDNGFEGAYKRADLETYVNGAGSEGTIWEITTSGANTFRIGTIVMRIQT